MVNSVQNAAQQAYLNPFQSKSGQVQNQQNEKDKETAETQGKSSGTDVVTKTASEDQSSPVATTESRESRSDAQNTRPARGSLLDISV